MPFTIGQNVGPYRILEQLGQGGMATVFKAYHAALDRYVAIKVLHPAFLEDATFLARFTREARVVAKLEHPNIVPIYDYSESAGQPYLVMKYIEGETLKARLARGPLSAEDAIRIVEAVGAALAFAHSKGILHRDIKPSNVLLTPEGGIFLADFGLARIAQSGESTLSSDMLLGTPHYISPEQAQGLKNLDEGTDIYSLGVVLYELSVGRVPFNADTPFSIIHDHIFTPLPLPRVINPKVPEEVERVLLKALAKDRKDRFADVDSLVKAFVAAIRTILGDKKAATGTMPKIITGGKIPVASHSSKAGASPQASSKKAFWKRVPKWVWVVLIVILCACLCFFTVAILGDRESRKEQATQTAAALILTTPETSPIPEVDIPQDAREAWAHLEKGFAYLDSGDMEMAIKEFTVALEMMPAERTGVIILASQKLGARGQWIMAASFCLKGLQTRTEDSAFRTASAEAFFRAAGEKDAGELMRQLSKNYPDWAIAQASMARWMTAFSPNPRDASDFLQRARKLAKENEMPFVKTVSGEYECVTGNTAQGIPTLKGVLGDTNTPPWLRVEVERILARWQ